MLSAHTDDAELGAGATISKLSENQHSVQHVVFSICGEDNHSREFEEASRILQVQGSIVDVKHRVFPEMRQTICDHLYGLRKSLDPDLVLCPYSDDIHQDHQTIANETVRAFRRGTSIWMYELPHNCPSFQPTVFIPLEEKHLQKKLDALACYRSMLQEPYFNKSLIRGVMLMRGLQCESSLAEAFHGYRTRQTL